MLNNCPHCEEENQECYECHLINMSDEDMNKLKQELDKRDAIEWKMSERKVTNYGSRLMVLINDHTTNSNFLNIYEVEDCSLALDKWKPIKLIESKKIDKNLLCKFNEMWEKTGKAKIKLDSFDLINLS